MGKRLLLLFGPTFYVVLMLTGLVANYQAPRLPFQVTWEENAWTVRGDAPPLQTGDLLTHLEQPVTFPTLLVDNAFLSSGDQFLEWQQEKANSNWLKCVFREVVRDRG